MKKYLIYIVSILLLLIPIKINALEETVKFSNCVDVDSARFILGVNEIKVKFLGIQKVTIAENEEDFSEKIVNEYVCKSLENAKEIKLVYNNDTKEEDNYGRILAWIFLDGNLLQEDLLKKGYVKILFLDENNTYSEQLKEAQNYAKENKIGVWKEELEEKQQEEIKDNNKSEERKSVFSIIFDFFADIFRKIRDFIDGIINNILN